MTELDENMKNVTQTQIQFGLTNKGKFWLSYVYGENVSAAIS